MAKKPLKAKAPPKRPATDLIQSSVELTETAALPSAGVVHTNPDAPCTPEQQPLPDAFAAEPVDQKSPAQWAYERLILYIKNFEEQLDDKHEIAMGFTGGEAGVLRIEGIGYFAPDIITFYGRDDEDTRTQLVQHVSQLNVLLQALPKPQAEPEPRRIGFRLAAEIARK